MRRALQERGKGQGTLPRDWFPLPYELGRFIDAEVRARRYASPGDVVAYALERYRRAVVEKRSERFSFELQALRLEVEALLEPLSEDLAKKLI